MRFIPTLSVLFLAGLAFLIYSWIRSLPATSVSYPDDFTATVEAGEEIFWGRGRCHVCHRIGESGYALRGPNLGDSSEGPIMAVRAQQRAAQLGLSNATEYLVQSLVEPGAFVAPNFQDEMPKPFEAPIALSPAEIKAIVLFLQSLGGDTNIAAIRLPTALTSSRETTQQAKPFERGGDAVAGRALFFDPQGPAACASCHVGLDESGVQRGGTKAPDLSAIASIRTPQYLYEKILRPETNLVSGYRYVLVRINDGQLLIGQIEREDAFTLQLNSVTGERIDLLKRDIAAVTPQAGTAMPTNYEGLLSSEQVNNLVAYLLTLHGS